MKDPAELNSGRGRIEKEHRKFYLKLKRRPPPGLDREVEKLDEEAFTAINCLDCANCCKTISPVFKERDITGISSQLGLRPGEFVERYLYIDKDGDYVLKAIPCPFLQSDNRCSIYEVRPAACKGYPHTGSLPLSRSWELVIRNSAICPAVFDITERLRKKYG